MALLMTATVVGGAVLYFFTSFFANRIANAYLAPLGLELRAIEGLRVSSSIVSAEIIRFAYTSADISDSSDPESVVENLSVSFSPAQLLKGQFRTFEIEALTLINPVAKNTAAADQFPADIAQSAGVALDVTQWLATLQALPLDSLYIERLSVADMVDDASVRLTHNNREIITQIKHDRAGLDLRINWHDDQLVSSNFIPTDELPAHQFLPRTVTGSIRLENNEESVLQGEFTVSEDQGQLLADTAGTLHLAPGKQLLESLHLLSEAAGNYDGTLYFSGNAQGHTDQHVDISLAILADSSARVSPPTTSPNITNTIAWHADEPLTVSGIYTPGNFVMTLNNTRQSLTATRLSGAAAHTAMLNITEATGKCTQPLRCTATVSSTLRVPTFSYGEFVIESISADSAITLGIEDATLTATLAQGSRIGAARIQAFDIDLEHANLLMQEAITISMNETLDISIIGNGVELFMPTIRVGASSGHAAIRASSMQAQWPSVPSTTPEVSVQLDARSFGIDLLPFELRKPEATALLQLSNNTLKASAVFRAAERDLLTMEGSAALTGRTAKINVKIPRLQFGMDSESLAYLFQNLPVDADIVSGSVTASADLSLRLDDDAGLVMVGPVQFNAAQLSGFYTDTALVDFSTDLNGAFVDSGGFVSSPTQRALIGSINPGLAVENIEFTYGIDTRQQTLDLHDFQATLFDGTLRSSGSAYQLSAAENNLTLTLERLDLGTLLDMGAYEGIQASGILSGSIPIRIEGSAISVAEGTLHIEAPGGSIQYQSGNAGNSGNAALDLVNQALSNYQYDSLEAAVNYLPSGDLNLAVKLQGANPDMNQGQRINLNLNISDNIPSLLQSLQASRSITDTLERELQKR